MEHNNFVPHRIALEDRSSLSVTGVEHVERFDENSIVLETTEGLLIIEGESLHIGSLRVDGGELAVEGRIDALAYEETSASRPGLLGRLFG